MPPIAMVGTIDPPTDEALALAVRAGDRDAFTILVDRYREMAFAYACARLGTRDEAEDAAQEAFVRAFAGIGAFRADGCWAAWFMRILRNHCHDLLRRRSVRGRDAADSARMDDSPGPEQIVLGQMRRADLTAAVHALPEKYRTPLLMRYRSCRTYREIALALGIRHSTVVGRLAAALRLLRRRMMEADV